MISVPVLLKTARLAQWSEAIGENFLPLEFRCHRHADFHGTARMASIGAGRATEICASAQKVARTPQLAGRSDSAYVKALWQLNGETFLEQDGAAARLGPGSWATYDASRPYALELSANSHFITLLMPWSDKDETPRLVRRLAASALQTEGYARVALDLLRQMLHASSPIDAFSGSLLHQSLMNMLQASLRLELMSRVGTDAHCGDRLSAARSHIDRHLHDATLEPATVARALNMSRRSLYNLFEHSGDSPCAYLQRRRLERARDALADPLLARNPITTIAYDHGFSDAAHFSRRFHERYGESPSAYRQRVASKPATERCLAGVPP
ncbi:helix-turn-helix domain-containing protein [Aromatoleum bremense]|uniref:helix-turn-helix domain-containing protein n=1 Tax=Aromatoleum bremense TaxID=76115 RepID=UPI00145F5A20|nr:helix-turn-helix domain-containing protein [Aromatoleum bremense]QTQ30018.1 Transcriptional regulator, AraC-type [Aromatoleum bremense]